ncbi:putative MFS-type transporter EfpA [Grifola frondosa]|uniref:Putative MFS-type transporter EfpA n=1 Tax=Grifola frondosa TaxID=5627 RepID=A0A1C7M7B3_GRIFR|nr:putative MFS-type transporter EfpA [Grifola frondosa]
MHVTRQNRARFQVETAFMLPSPGPSNNALSPAQTLVDGKLPQRLSTFRRYVLLLIFCLAQFLDAFNNSALFSAIPSLVIALDMSESESTWIISAFQLTFASFLLIAVVDAYDTMMVLTFSTELAFIFGVAVLGFISVGAGFVNDKVTLIVLRALSGIAASMTIPSALTLLVNVFSEPTEQARAIGVFGGCGAIGNVLGLIIGAIFVEFASWSWVFWFVALVAVPIAGICILLIPAQEPRLGDVSLRGAKWKSLDIVGVSILTAALILFIFAVTSGSAAGWASAMVLAPLIVSIIVVVAFFYYETIIPVEKAAVPPRTWFLPNFSVLFGTALLPYFWWTTIFTLYTTLWQDIWHWSVISTAIHMIPLGVMAFAMSFTGSLSRKVNPKWIILCGECLCIVATLLLAFADRPQRYWPFVFPAFVLGSSGAMLTYTHTKWVSLRSDMRGASQLTDLLCQHRDIPDEPAEHGRHGGRDIQRCVTTRLRGRHRGGRLHRGEHRGDPWGPEGYAGRAAAFWFLLAVVGVEALSMLVFYRAGRDGTIGERRKEDGVEEAEGERDEGKEERMSEKDEIGVAPV